MADAPGKSPGRTAAGRTLDDQTRAQLLAVISEELARASDDALARGMSPDELAEQLNARIARLRAQIADLPVDGEPNKP